MPPRLLPLFPLQVVVFPRTRVPLHIFEERYKAMVKEAITQRSEFGIVLAKENGIVNSGCTVVIEGVVKTYPDGRMDVLVGGRRRFEILSLDQEKDYLRGEVEFFDDDEPGPAPPDMQRRVLEQFKALVEIGAIQSAPDISDPQLSFQLAQAIEDPDFLTVLLRNRSETERMKELNDYLSVYVPRQRQITKVKRVAPLNGFGGKPAGLK